MIEVGANVLIRSHLNLIRGRRVGVITNHSALLGLLAFLSTPTNTTSGSSLAEQIKWHDFNEGVSLAQKENKKLLVDVDTDWCVWYKKMDQVVYSDDGVRQSIASHFIAAKLNAESSKGVTFSSGIGKKPTSYWHINRRLVRSHPNLQNGRIER